MSFVSNTQLKRFAGDINTAIEDGTIKAGLAKNLTPYSGEMNIFQDVAFNLQGTATANGEGRIDTDTYCLLKEKRGNTVTVNQLVDPSYLPATQTINGVTFTNNGDGTITANGTAEADISLTLFTNTQIPLGMSGNPYFTFYVCGCPFGGSSDTYFCGVSTDRVWDIGNGYTGRYGWGYNYNFCIKSGVTITNKVISPKLVNLDLWFGSNDKIPTHLLNHPEDFFRYYQGSLAYNAGTLTDCNGRYLKTTGRNVWNEEWEQGSLDANGQPVSSTASIRSKTFTKIIPNAQYYFRQGQTADHVICYYDKDQNFISRGISNAATHLMTIPDGTMFFKLRLDYSGTYKNDVTISLYYEGEGGYDKYYPYEELANIDTGNEPLLAFDWKEPNGTIHHDTGKTNDLSTLSWNYDSSAKAWATATASLNIKQPENNATVVNAKSSKYVAISTASGYGNDTAGIMYHNTSGTLYVNNGSSSTEPSGSFEYELKDGSKTTEQGTPFKEGIGINDFGTMEFISTNGIPQGNKILYSPDYKASLDTLCKYLDGNMSNITKLEGVGESLSDSDPKTVKEILDEIRALHAIEQENAGGTLRHMLADRANIDFENTTWMDLADASSWTIGGTYNNIFYSVVTGIKLPESDNLPANALCSGYTTKSYTELNVNDDTTTGFAIRLADSTLRIKDPSCTTVDALKTKIRGILFAYEKAST